jgi:hypothetical protein
MAGYAVSLYPVDVRERWDDIKPGLEIIKQRYGVDWRPEDVYHVCLDKETTVLMSDEDKGFIILQDWRNPYNLRKELIIWIAFTGCEARRKYLPDILNQARQNGYSRVLFQTSRDGYDYRKEGWRVKDITYVYDLEKS